VDSNRTRCLDRIQVRSGGCNCPNDCGALLGAPSLVAPAGVGQRAVVSETADHTFRDNCDFGLAFAARQNCLLAGPSSFNRSGPRARGTRVSLDETRSAGASSVDEASTQDTMKPPTPESSAGLASAR
jgi:hypothetical protein